MLSEADAAVVAREQALPGLALLLDASRMREALDALAPDEGITGVTPTYLRYKPGTSCVAGFRVERRSGAPVELYAKAFDAAHFAVVKARPKWPAHSASFALAPKVMDTLQVVVLGLQHDPKLKALRHLSGPGTSAKLLRKLLPRHDPGSLQLDVLRYKAERRFVGRLSQAQEPTAVLRVYAAQHFGAALVGASFGSAAGGPRLLGVQAEQHMLAVSWLPGAVLCPQAGTVPAVLAMERVGVALARLHDSDLVHPLRRSRELDAQAVRRAVEGLAALCPELGGRARSLANAVVAALADTPLEARLIHGDFSADQAIDTGEAIRLIDWDHAAGGDAAADLGSFCARLEMQVIDGVVSRDDADAALRAFREGYANTVRHEPATVELQTAGALLQLAAEPFRRRCADWPRRVQALLDRAAFHAGRARPAAAPTGGAGHHRDDAMPFLAVALDAAAMQPVIAHCLGDAAGAMRVHTARLIRHKPGRRCLIEYEVEQTQPCGGRFAVLGKGRAKGLDRNGFGVQQALWRKGFSDAGSASVAVPEPLLAIPELHLWLQRRVAGIPATELFTPQAGPSLARRVAEALATLHRAGVGSTRRWSVADELQTLQRRLLDAATLCPVLAQRIDALGQDCFGLASRLPPSMAAGIHRDFYADQVLVDGDRLYLLDLDLYCIGDPAVDAGNFIAHLTEQALRRHGDPAALVNHEQALAQRFLELSPGVSERAVEAYTTLSLARHIQLSTQFADRRHTTGRLLELCEARLRGGA